MPRSSASVGSKSTWLQARLSDSLYLDLLEPPLHRRRMNFFVKSFEFSCQTAQQTLGLVPKIDFDEGAKRTAAWYRQMKLLS